ncbi:ABC1 kinase family protein [Amnibacterium kyonggiense]|uniref:Ubiquinone biosynthesis protein n=1 Tax=Amnibacterium kyonggiense TaxID=595671 RepID=A0A4R7FFQ6_9MICO|nr:AarF/UbiB family protein [Amnibacterium kyonggiense]TDS75051.1 ubiquinone biosynthesis protein [Amnibacterium kyonggiense]
MNADADLDLLGVLVTRRDRLIEVAGVLRRYGFASIAAQLEGAGGPVRRAAAAVADRLIDPELEAESAGQRLRGALTEIGTTAIKLGQLLSLRPDVVGPAVAAELSTLRSSVPADPPGYAETTVQEELGADVSELFASFDPEPLASGSVAQVHRAVLHDGSRVVVKVLHRHVRRRVLEDLELLSALSVWAEAVSPVAHRLRFAAVVADFDRSMRGAVDLGQELANLQRFGAMFADDDGVRIPAAHPDRSATGVLTMEEMAGTVLDGPDSVRAAGWTPDDLANRTANVYLTMVFRHGAYHTDPHSGNFLLNPGVITILDFGDVARITRTKREQLEDLIAAVGTGDPAATTEALLAITDAPPDLEPGDVQDDVESLITDHLSGGVDTIDLTAVSRGVAVVVQRHGLSLPGEIALVLRVITLLQGLAADIGADIDLAEISRPFALDVARHSLDPRAALARALRTSRSWERLLETLPGEVTALLQQVRREGGADLRIKDPDGIADRIVDGLLTAALVLSAGELVSRGTAPRLGSISVPGVAVAGAAWLRWRSLRARRSGAPSAAARLRLAERVIRSARRPSAP